MEITTELSAIIIHSLRTHILIDLAKEKGIDLSDLLQNTEVNPEEIEKRSFTITAAQYALIVTNLLPLIKNTDFALEFGKRLNITSRGQVGIVLMSQPNLKEVIKFAFEFQKLLDIPHQGHIYHNQEGLLVEMESRQHPLLTDAFWQFNIETIIASFQVSASFLLQQKLTFKKVCFNFPEPNYGDAYRELFECPIEFNANTCAMLFPQDVLEIPIQTANATIAENSQQLFKKLLHQFQKTQPTSYRARAILSETLGNYPEQKDLAAKLSMNERTLRRKLAEEESSYQLILDDVRQQHAKRLLKNQQGSVEYIAKNLGFSDASSFRKAFKRWTGKTPIEYRNISKSA